MKYLRNANGIKVGDKFRYRSCVYVDGGYIAKGKPYDAEVIDVSKHVITLQLNCKKAVTIFDEEPNVPAKYNWAIRKVDVGTRERLYLINDDEQIA